MAQSPNQFALTEEQGVVDLKQGSTSIISGVIDSTSAGSLVAGQAVKLVNTAGIAPKFVECAADTDDVFGFIVYDAKKELAMAGDKVEVACFRGTVMYMTANAAIAPQAKVMVVIASKKVAVATTGKRIIGFALDKATNANDVIRVYIDLLGALAP